jgi:DNA-damage-inducible protein J
MTTTVQARVDEQLKAEADEVFRRIGLDTSTAVRMFLTKAVAVRGLPFDARDEPVTLDGMTLDITESELARAVADALVNRDLRGPFATASELVADLDTTDA